MDTAQSAFDSPLVSRIARALPRTRPHPPARAAKGNQGQPRASASSVERRVRSPRASPPRSPRGGVSHPFADASRDGRARSESAESRSRQPSRGVRSANCLFVPASYRCDTPCESARRDLERWDCTLLGSCQLRAELRHHPEVAKGYPRNPDAATLKRQRKSLAAPAVLRRA